MYAQSAITGTVIGNDNRPIDAVSVNVTRADRSITRETTTDALGSFRFASLLPGIYTVTARKVGYRSAEHAAMRVAAGQTINVVVTLTQAPRQLSTIQVVSSPTSVDTAKPGLAPRLARQCPALPPSRRSATTRHAHRP